VVGFAAVLALPTVVWSIWTVVPFGRTAVVVGWTETLRSDGWYVTAVDPGISDLHPGDRLISLNGNTDVERAGTFFLTRALSPGESIRLEIVRDGAPRQATLTVVSVTRPRLADLPWVFSTIVWCLPALFIGFSRPDQTQARLAFAGATITSFLFAARFLPAAGVLSSGLWPMHVVIGLHFFYLFPAGPMVAPAWRGVLMLCYASAAFTGAARYVSTAIDLLRGPVAATRWMADHAGLYQATPTIAQVTLLVAVASMVVVIPLNYRRLTSLDQRRRVKWVAYSAMAGLGARLVLGSAALLASIGGPNPGSLLDLIGAGGTAVIPIAVAYAVVKHRVLDITVVVRRGLRYLLAKRALQALLACPVLVMLTIAVTHRDLTLTQLVTGNSGYLYWTAAAAVSLRFRQSIWQWLDRRFFREHYDREHLLAGLLDDLTRLDSSEEVFRSVAARVEVALHPKMFMLWYCSPGGTTLAFSSTQQAGPLTFPKGRLLSALDRWDDVLDVPLPPGEDFSDEELTWLEAHDVRLIVPISGTRTIGFLLLGEKRSEDAYSAGDRRLLRSVAQQMAVVHENLDLKGRVDEEQRVRRDVLAHLDPRIIDVLKECPACGTCFDGPATHCANDGHALTMPAPVSRTVDHKYRLDRLIGRGGMGSVYEASDLRLDRTVAIKLMIGGAFGDERAVRRFQREAKTAARLNHSSVVSVYDYGGLPAGGAYLVMERLQGSSLRTELTRRGAMSPALVADVFTPVLDGVAAAHEAGIVHRDLKPENILGEWQASPPRAIKILDFGLAKFRPLDDAVTRTAITVAGVVVGTLGYMSPEQLTGAESDHRTDIFALGVILVEMLTGRRPFQGATYAEMLNAVLRHEYHLPGAAPEIRAIDRIVQGCLAKKPDNRTASVTALKEELLSTLAVCPPLSGGGHVLTDETRSL
jgi:hypothetical protein